MLSERYSIVDLDPRRIIRQNDRGLDKENEILTER